MYKKCYDGITNAEAPCVLRKEDGVIIPFDPANRDYQEYLEWVEEGNVAEEWNPDIIEGGGT